MYGTFRARRVIGECSSLATEFTDGALSIFSRRGSGVPFRASTGETSLFLWGRVRSVGEDFFAVLRKNWCQPDRGSFLRGLDGNFLLVVYEADRQRVSLVTDRNNSLRCYYWQERGSLAFFPQLYYFRDRGFPWRANEEFALQFLTLTYLPGNETPFEGVRLVPGGSVLTFHEEEERLERYFSWNFPQRQEHLGYGAEEIDTLHQLFVRAVEKRAEGRSSVVLPLSGGLDSRAILGALQECRPASGIEAVTFGTPGSLDYEIGGQIAREEGLRWHCLDLPSLGEDTHFLDREYRKQMELSDGVSRAVTQVFPTLWREITGKVAFTGFMGDFVMGKRLFQDYYEHPSHANPREFFERTLPVHVAIAPQKAAPLLGMDQEEATALLLDAMLEANGHNTETNPAFFHEAWDAVNRQLGVMYLSVLQWREDVWWETPFLDTELVEFIMNGGVSWRFQQALYREMLRKHFPRLAAYPTKNLQGKPLLASGETMFEDRWLRRLERLAARFGFNFVRRYRQRLATFRTVNYLDFNSLFKNPSAFRCLFAKKIDRLLERNLICADELQLIIDDHRTGKQNNTKLLLAVLNVELAFEVFATGEQGTAFAKV
jgi:asparagine synthase (glutamine-hydrolysing)